VLFSSGPSASSSWTKELLRRFFGLEGKALDITDFCLRKAGHVTYYGILALLLALTLSAWLGRKKSWLLLGAAFAFLTACFDEYRQSFYANRNGSPYDLFYDGAGVAFAALWLARSGQYSSSDRH
jgi:VanZ family protein